MREAAKGSKERREDDDWLPNLPDFKRGASTITQQLAKNLISLRKKTFLSQGRGSDSDYFPGTRTK